MKTGQKTRNLFIKKKQKKTNKQKTKNKKKAMRDLAAKKSAKNRSLTFKKGRRGSLLRRDFSLSSRKSRLFWYFLGAFRGADFSRPSTCGRDVTLFPRHDARDNTTTHTHLRERRENVIKDDSPSDVVEARHRVKRRTVRRASGGVLRRSRRSRQRHPKSIVIIVL